MTTPSPTLTSADLAQRAIARRAVEAALWGMPMVNIDAMRQAYFRDAGAAYNDVVYWSHPSDWKNQTTTPNSTTNYVMFFVNLQDGPVVVEIPPVGEAALYGTLADAWMIPLMDVGNTGEDAGKGGKYLLLPPGYEDEVPDGFIPVPSLTYNVFSLLRVIAASNSEEDLATAITYLKQVTIAPLSGNGSAPMHFIDMAGKLFDGIAAYDASFYTSLARMVAEEPVQERDLAILGQFLCLGIGKDLTFAPASATTALLEDAIAEAHTAMMDAFAASGFPWWPDRRWLYLVSKDALETRMTFVRPEQAVLIDDRAATWFSAYGPIKEPKTANLYLKTHIDQDGQPLTGDAIYRLTVPAHVPTSQFWSVNVYDAATTGFIREAAVVGRDSHSATLQTNDDGSVDLYLAPTAPEGQDANWIATDPGKPFFLLFRAYGPEESLMKQSTDWMLSDIALMD